MAHWLSLITDYRRTLATPWQPRDAVEILSRRRLSAMVHHAYCSVPYYRRLFDAAGIHPRDIARPGDLPCVPVSTKSELRDHPLNERVAVTAGADPWKSETSSGSTGTPLTVYFDKAYYRTRSLIFLRGLITAGYRPGQRLLLVTRTGPEKATRRWLNWRYASIEDPPGRLAAGYRHFRPHVLYGCTTGLRLLAETLGGRALDWTPRAVITTAEGLDAATRALLGASFKATVYDFYGLSEMGLIGWQCFAGSGYHLAEDLVVAEFLPVAGNGQLSRLVLTNLAQRVMPFIRYDTGDLCVPVKESCPCGRSFSLVSRFEGREVDCLLLPDGTRISPYRVTCEFEKLADVGRYQVRQDDYARFSVLLETRVDKPGPGESAVRCLNGLLGIEADITVRYVPRIEQHPGRKFRVVESRLVRNDPQAGLPASQPL